MISQLRAEKEFFTTEQKPSQHIALRCLYVSTKAITAPDLRILEFNLVLLIILLPLLLLLIDIITLSRLAILKIDQVPALASNPSTAPNTGNAGPITTQAATPATVPSAAATSLGPVAILPYPKPGVHTSQKPTLNKRARALSSTKRNDANRVTKPGPSGTHLPIRSLHGPNDAYKPVRGGNIDPALGAGGNDDSENDKKKTEKLQALGKDKTTGASGRTGEPANRIGAIPLLLPPKYYNHHRHEQHRPQELNAAGQAPF
ncbi:hypothetical protein F4821DRAFT_257298 [Hypoxylon rubiginosum]|uniref:Uncharacterized protein n=1 Tax=Hypoxylon rubiginosum TaxID=110542 RepID=A0ACC0D8R5_9PEZI|nr:hypothetical protein F4821DRAFT_257298 [Hypoxylon rubiginosum]